MMMATMLRIGTGTAARIGLGALAVVLGACTPSESAASRTTTTSAPLAAPVVEAPRATEPEMAAPAVSPSSRFRAYELERKTTKHLDLDTAAAAEDASEAPREVHPPKDRRRERSYKSW